MNKLLEAGHRQLNQAVDAKNLHLASQSFHYFLLAGDKEHALGALEKAGSAQYLLYCFEEHFDKIRATIANLAGKEPFAGALSKMAEKRGPNVMEQLDEFALSRDREEDASEEITQLRQAEHLLPPEALREARKITFNQLVDAAGGVTNDLVKAGVDREDADMIARRMVFMWPHAHKQAHETGALLHALSLGK